MILHCGFEFYLETHLFFFLRTVITRQRGGRRETYDYLTSVYDSEISGHTEQKKQPVRKMTAPCTFRLEGKVLKHGNGKKKTTNLFFIFLCFVCLLGPNAVNICNALKEKKK